MIFKRLLIIASFFQILWTLSVCNDFEEAEDLYSSVTVLNEIFNAEKILIENLSDFISKSEESTIYLKRFIHRWKTNQQKENRNVTSTNVDIRSSFSTQLKALIKLLPIKQRFSLNTSFLQLYLNLTVKEAIENYRQQSSDNSLILPTEHDLKGVTLGLLRVQEVYSVSAEQMANGVINGIKFNSTFSAADCFEVARVLAKENYHYYAIEWYKMALERFDEEGWRGIQPAIKKNLIVSNLGHSLYAEGGAQNLATAIEIISKTLKENSHENDLELTKNLKEYVDHFTALTSNISTVSEKIFPQGALNVYSFEEMNILRKGCTGQLKKSPSEERKLFCKYEKNNHPFLMLAPLKLEILNFSPYLVIFHEVLYDSEIEMLKELSADRLVRAKVWNPSEGRAEVSNVRTGKYLWIYDDEYPLMSVLNQRLNDMTGMTMETSEAFQMMNYGIGGHYDLHSDDLNEPSEENDFQPFSYYEWGNRISTVLFYLSDVQYGGGTIWPKINVIAYPRKGTAAFWYNLRHDGQPDFKSQHAACPVILGSKWVMNKWIRMGGQMFRKPCRTMQY